MAYFRGLQRYQVLTIPNTKTLSSVAKSYPFIYSKKFHKNISFSNCSDHSRSLENGFEQYQVKKDSSKRLSVILAWLGAEDKHLRKYQSFWIMRGFDVLTVKLYPRQVIFPTIGCIPVIQEVIRILHSASAHYQDLLIHCFSAGSYQFGEIFAQLNDESFLSQISDDADPKYSIENAIKGVIMDSAINLKGCAPGIGHAMMPNSPFLSKGIELAVKGHMKLSYSLANKYYKRASDFCHGNYLTHAPALIIASERDQIATSAMSRHYFDLWTKSGVPTTMKIFPESEHVKHFVKYPEEYSLEIDNLLKCLSN